MKLTFFIFLLFLYANTYAINIFEKPMNNGFYGFTFDKIDLKKDFSNAFGIKKTKFHKGNINFINSQFLLSFLQNSINTSLVNDKNINFYYPNEQKFYPQLTSTNELYSSKINKTTDNQYFNFNTSLPLNYKKTSPQNEFSFSYNPSHDLPKINLDIPKNQNSIKKVNIQDLYLTGKTLTWIGVGLLSLTYVGALALIVSQLQNPNKDPTFNNRVDYTALSIFSYLFVPPPVITGAILIGFGQGLVSRARKLTYPPQPPKIVIPKPKIPPLQNYNFLVKVHKVLTGVGIGLLSIGAISLGTVTVDPVFILLAVPPIVSGSFLIHYGKQFKKKALKLKSFKN